MPNRVFITGDKHGNFISPDDYQKIDHFCEQFDTDTTDVMIVLGDHGMTYYSPTDKRTINGFKKLAKFPITFIMIRGNHDQRPCHYTTALPEYIETPAYSGRFSKLQGKLECKNVLFTEEYGWYTFAGNRVFVVGGAYSVDKYYRLEMYDIGFHDYHWFHAEQLSANEMIDAEKTYFKYIDLPHIVMSHTCPINYEPQEMFLGGIGDVDKSMEIWLGGLEFPGKYSKWYCGHFHTDKTVGNARFLYHDIIELPAPVSRE